MSDMQPPRIVRNEWFYFVARACMIGASLIGLPLASWTLNRIVAQADTITSQVATQNLTLQLLKDRVDLKISGIEQILNDHELRLRRAEQR